MICLTTSGACAHIVFRRATDRGSRMPQRCDLWSDDYVLIDLITVDHFVFQIDEVHNDLVGPDSCSGMS